MVACVLVVEDERKIRELLRSYLEHDGLSVLTAATGADGLDLARSAEPDLVVLDLRLPDIPGEEVAREIRARARTPIMMLTAKAEPADRIHGLELGADDYVTKPFSPREVVLRVRAILRRTENAAPADGPASFGHGLLTIDETRHQVSVRGEPVQLTASEWGLLITLATTPGRVFTRGELINRVRGYEFDGYQRTIDTHVKNLRHKIETDQRHPAVIDTVVGVGYRFVLNRDRADAAR